MSQHCFEMYSFGTGKLDEHGFWEIPCWECARAFEKKHPDAGPCWPHTPEQLKAMGFGDTQ